MGVSAQAASYRGEVYLRSDSVPLGTNQESGIPIVGSTVKLGNGLNLTDSNGFFSSTNSVENTQKTTLLISEAAGYITSWKKLQYAESGLINVGLYPEISVKARPGFLSGAYTWDPNGMDSYFRIHEQNLYVPTIETIKSRTGSNIVGIADPAFIVSYDIASAKVVLKKTTKYLTMLPRKKYEEYVTAAHSRGLKFMLTLGVYPDVGVSSQPYGIDSSHKEFWDAWFAAYTPIVREYSEIARDTGIDYLSLGMNLGYMSSLPVSYWRDLVSVVRSTGYKGRLLYQAMAFPKYGANESDWFNGAGNAWTSEEKISRRIEFASLFDFIGINIYDVSQSDSPLTRSRSDMRNDIKKILDKLTDLPVPVIVQIGTPSTAGGAVRGEYIEPCLPCDSLAPQRGIDVDQQADAYQALSEVVNETDTGNGRVMGILSWGYWFTEDDYEWKSPDGRSYPNSFDKSASIRGKPAESVLRWWTAKFLGNPLPPYQIQKSSTLLRTPV